MEDATVAFGTTRMLFGSWRMIVLRQFVSSTYPCIPLSSWMKSPGWTLREARMWTPANRLLSVSCKARATARPPTPRAVSSGVMATPRLSSRTSPPIVHTITRVMLTKMVADPEVPAWDVAPARTAAPATFALPRETTTTMTASSAWSRSWR